MIAPARIAAYEILRAVSAGADLGSALAHHRSRLEDERDRALAGEIATGTLRWRGAFDHVAAAFTKRPLAKLDPEVVEILRLTMFQLLHLDRIPASAAVKDAVDLTGKVGKRSAAGLVNAVLRRVSRERAQLPLPHRPEDPSDRSAALAYLSVTCSHPEWFAARLLDRVGFEAAESWLLFNNAPAVLTIRANTLKTNRTELMQALQSEGIDAEAASYAEDALLVRSGNPLSSTLHDRGLFLVQDEASQLVGEFAGARPGERILDACASPGGKTIQMAAAMRGRGLIVASDARAKRIRLLVRTLQRAEASMVRVVQADALAGLPFATSFDRVLLDAPCSGLGTVRRDPDIKWRRREADLPALARSQQQMLSNAARVLAPGGVVVYSTCSSEPEENEGVVEAFLSQHPAFQLVGTPLRTFPHTQRLEAFFAAMLVSAKHLR